MLKRRLQKRSGQAMLIAVLSLGGAMLGATAIAGLLILYQLRATTNAVDSAQAIFAADTGTNWALYSYFCPFTTYNGNERCASAPAAPKAFSNGASSSIACYNAAVPPEQVSCYNNATVSYAVSVGSANGTRRAFYLNLLVATTTFP